MFEKDLMCGKKISKGEIYKTLEVNIKIKPKKN